MGRPTRLKAPDLTYHITSRTDGHRIFFKFKRDRRALCRIIRQVFMKYGVILYSFTCMGNHFHMLIRIVNDADLSQIMCEIKTKYAKHFNRRYGRRGHFWGDRFRSTIVEDDKYALACLRYIDRNPVKAGLVGHPRDWLCGTFPAYAMGKIHPVLHLHPHPTYLALSPDRQTRRSMYAKFVMDEDYESDSLSGRLPRLRIYGSEDFIQAVERRTQGSIPK